MRVSKIGEKFTAPCGINQLMEDLGNAVAGSSDIIMLGGGNPSHIPAVQQKFRARMDQMLANGDEFEHLIGDYDPPAGNPAFRTAVAALLNDTYGWPVSADNIVLTNGSQTAFFYLFNLLAGEFADGTHKKILLPLAPEYIGYVDAGIDEDLFVAQRPQFQFLDEHTFKYRVDFDALEIDESVSAICVSRPTNPTGNVLTNHEIEKLRLLAHQHDIPLIIDNAYGAPFPGIIFDDIEPIWDEQIILCLSLSKLGLPGVRTGIIVAREEIAAIRGQHERHCQSRPGERWRRPGFGDGAQRRDHGNQPAVDPPLLSRARGHGRGMGLGIARRDPFLPAQTGRCLLLLAVVQGPAHQQRRAIRASQTARCAHRARPLLLPRLEREHGTTKINASA